MPIPNFDMIMLPLLDNVKMKELSTTFLLNALAGYFELEEEELREVQAGHPIFFMNVQQALIHLSMAGLKESITQDNFKITPLGKRVLAMKLNKIDIQFLKRLPGYAENVSRM